MPRLNLIIRLLRMTAGVALIALVMLLLTAAGQLRAAPAQVTVVRCDPEVVTADSGDTVSFTIYVENVVGLYAADVQMSFDPAVAQVIDADSNKGGTQIEMLDEFLALDFTVRDRADNMAGTIWYANTQVNPSQPVSGSGPLARVTMQSLTHGSFNVPITSQELAMIDGTTIPATTRDCRVTFFNPNLDYEIYMPVAFAR